MGVNGIFRFVTGVGLAIALLLGTSARAEAGAILLLTDGVNFVVVEDEGVGDTLSGTVGAVGFSGDIGVFDLNLTGGFTKPALGSADDPLMDVLSFSASGGAGSLLIGFSDTDFLGTSPLQMSIGGTMSAPAGSEITFIGCFDETNTIFGCSSAIGSLGPFGPGAFSGALDGLGPTIGPYALTTFIGLNHTGEGFTSFDATITPIPEPATLALLGLGLAATGAKVRRRRKALSN